MTRKVNPIVSVFETSVSCNLIELARLRQSRVISDPHYVTSSISVQGLKYGRPASHVVPLALPARARACALEFEGG